MAKTTRANLRVGLITPTTVGAIPTRAKEKRREALYVATETEEQAALFKWAALIGKRYPEYSLLYAIPNAGKRGAKARGDMLRTGLRAGVPDICLPIPRGPYGALYIEMKRLGKKPTREQADWIAKLRSAGNYVRVAYNWDEAKKTITRYLSLPSLCNRDVTRSSP
jgi:hypothetical protein